MYPPPRYREADRALPGGHFAQAFVHIPQAFHDTFVSVGEPLNQVYPFFSKGLGLGAGGVLTAGDESFQLCEDHNPLLDSRLVCLAPILPPLG